MKTLIALLLATTGVIALAGPFGFEKGQAQDLYANRLKDLGGGFYSLEKAPAPHPKMESYSLFFSRSSGLAAVVGIGLTINCNSFGDELKAAHREFEEALTAKYGKPERYDFLQRGSIWDEPNDWMMALLKGERHLLCSWKPAKGATFPDSIVAIELQAEALSSNKAYVRIVYRFSNYEEAKAEMAKKANSVL